MAQRQAGGAQGRSGRYHKHDTARKRCLERRVYPDLRMGKLPSDLDSRMLFDLPGPREIAGPAKKDMDLWANIYGRDPRSAPAAANDLQQDIEGQTNLLRWALQSGVAMIDATGDRHGRVGRPLGYRLTSRNDKINGKTVDEVARGDGWFLRWMCAGSFDFQFPKHEYEYLELLRLEQSGTVAQFNRWNKETRSNDTVRWRVKLPDIAHRRFEEFAIGTENDRRRLALHAAKRALSEESDDGDAADAESPASLDRTQNSVNQATLNRFRQILREMAHGRRPNYSQWRSMIVPPDDPTIAEPFSADAWDVLSVLFWCPIKFWARLGVSDCPCARKGWAHARYTRVRQFRPPRLAKDAMDNDLAVSPSDVICSECQREHAAAKRALQLARAQNADAAEISELEKAVQRASYKFTTAHLRVLALLGKRYPFVLARCPFTLSHRAGLTFDTTMDLARAARTAQQPHDLEAKYDEFKAIKKARTMLAFVAVQRQWRRHAVQRAQLDKSLTDPLLEAQKALGEADREIERAQKRLDAALAEQAAAKARVAEARREKAQAQKAEAAARRNRQAEISVERELRPPSPVMNERIS